MLPALFVSRFNVNELAEGIPITIEALAGPANSVASGSVAPREGFRTAATRFPAELLIDNVIVSFAYPPNPKTLTIVTVPALRRYCFAVKGT